MNGISAKKLLKENFSDVVLVIAFIVYVSIVIVGFLHHESFRDEGQAWLLARDLNIFELIYQMKYEGHFLLWYLLIMPFAKLGFPYFTMSVISVTLCAIGVFLFLFFAPMPKLARIPFAFLVPVIFYFPIIARCYSLLPLSFALIAMFHKSRHERPVRYFLSIILLANVHIYMWGLVFALLMEFFLEFIADIKKKGIWNKDFKAMIFLAVLLLVSVAPVLFSLTTEIALHRTCETLFDAYISMFIYSFSYDFTIAIELLLLLLCALCFAFAWRETAMFTVSFLYQLIIAWKVIDNNSTRASIWVAVLYFVVALYFEKTDRKSEFVKKIEYRRALGFLISVLIVFVFAVSIIVGANMLLRDYQYCYSNSKDVAKFIDENIEKDAVLIVGCKSEILPGILPYLDKNTEVQAFQYSRGEYFTYQIWDENIVFGIDEDFEKNIDNWFSSEDNLYLIVSAEVAFENGDSEWTLLEASCVKELVENGVLEQVYSDRYYSIQVVESYVIYKINH